MTTVQREQLLETGRRAWRFLQVVGTLGALAISALLASGWRVQKPSELLGNIEAALISQDQRLTVLERNYATLHTGQQTIMRLQCLATTRRDANLAGACDDLPTRDDSRNGRR